MWRKDTVKERPSDVDGLSHSLLEAQWSRPVVQHLLQTDLFLLLRLMILCCPHSILQSGTCPVTETKTDRVMNEQIH